MKCNLCLCTVFKCKFKLNISSLRVKEVPLKRTPGFSQYNTGELSVNKCEGMSYLKKTTQTKEMHCFTSYT